MRMICQGPTCGKVFEAKRRTAKYCSSRCSVAACRAGLKTEPQVAEEPGAGAGRSDRGMPAKPGPQLKFQPEAYETTLETLQKAGRVRTHGGQVALWLAARIDAGGAETGSAAASLATAHAAAVDRALTGDQDDDPVARREQEVADRARKFTVVRP